MLIADTWKDMYQYFDWISQFEPWDNIGETDPIVIERPGKRTVYVRILGKQNEQCGISVYFTEEDYLAANAGEDYLWCEDEHYICLQNAIIGLWGDEEYISKYNRNILMELNIQEDNGLLPHFDRYEYGYAPMKVKTSDSAELADILKHTYQAVSYMDEKVPDLRIPEGKVLLRYYDDRGKKWVTCLEEHPILQADRDFYWEITDARCAQLQDMKAKGTWTVLMDLLPDMLMDHKKGMPYFPTSIEITKKHGKTEKKMFEDTFKPDEIVEQGVLWDVLYDLCGQYGKPEEIVIENNFMFCRMVDFCRKAGIRLTNKAHEVQAQLEHFIQENSEELMEYFRQILQEEEQDLDAEEYEELSFVISVSLGTGLYRHILISAAATLEDLHKAILDAFGFDDDHLHMFCLTPAGSTARRRYYSRYMEDEYMTTDRYMLAQVLDEGQKFRYVFDFGASWEFNGKVLRINDEPCGRPVVIRSKGEAPEQYPSGEDV